MSLKTYGSSTHVCCEAILVAYVRHSSLNVMHRSVADAGIIHHFEINVKLILKLFQLFWKKS